MIKLLKHVLGNAVIFYMAMCTASCFITAEYSQEYKWLLLEPCIPVFTTEIVFFKKKSK